MKRLQALVLLLPVLIAACDTRSMPVTPDPPLDAAAELFDGRSPGGTPGFYFFPPLAPRPNPTGVANMTLRPSLKICPLDSSLTPDCTRPNVVVFDPDDVRTDAELYIVNWNTDERYIRGWRIFVSHEGRDTAGNVVDVPLGFRDVWGCGLQCAVPPGDFHRFSIGSVVRIRFRIEQGVLCGSSTLGGAFEDCAEGILGSQLLVTPEAKAAVIVCDGDVGDPSSSCSPTDLSEEVTILIYRDTAEFSANDNDPTRCIDSLDMPQGADVTSGCYRARILTSGFSTIEPGKRAFFTLCVDETSLPPSLPEAAENVMVMFKEDANGNVERLNIVDSQLGCPGNDPLALAPSEEVRGLLTRWARAGWQLAARAVTWLAPEPLLAVLHRGRGGELDTFSLFTVALTGTYEKRSADGLLFGPGAVVQPSPRVLVSSTDELGVDFGVAGARVRFSIPNASGDGAVICKGSRCATRGSGQVVVRTNVEGIAWLDTWTLGSASGTYYVDAQVLGACPVGRPDCAADGTEFVRFEASVCGLASGVAQVDGSVGADEWQCAFTQPFQAKAPNGSMVPAEWKWMSDGTSLYMAVTVQTPPDPRRNFLRFDFDDDGDMAPDAGDNVFELSDDVPGANKLVDKYLRAGCVTSTRLRCGARDAVAHGQGAFGGGSSIAFELSFPLSTGDGQDFDAIDDGLRSFLTMMLGTATTQVPAFRDYSCVVLAGTSGSPPVGGCN